MTKRSKFWGGKFFITAACVATLTASIPNAQINAYSITDVPSFATTLGIRGRDFVEYSVVAADGGYVVLDTGETTVSGRDQVIVAKYSNTGEAIWRNILTETTYYSVSRAITSLSNGNYLAMAIVNDSPTLFEISDYDGHVISTTTLGRTYNFYDITEAAVDYDGAPLVVGVTYSKTIYAFIKDQDSYKPALEYYMSDSVQVYSIRQDDDGGFVSLGYDTATDTYLIIHADSNGHTSFPLSLDSNAGLYDIAPYNGGYVIVGSYGKQMSVWKTNNEGDITGEYTLEGQSDQGDESCFMSVDILSNGNIVTVGYSNYDRSQAINILGSSDAVIARLDSNLNPISVRSYGSDGADYLFTVKADGDRFYVGGTSKSYYMGIDYVGDEFYGIVARFGAGVAADVTFHIDGDIPEGIYIPEDGTYYWDENGNNDLTIPASTDNQIFSGWYTDEKLTNKLGDQIPDDDLNLYGKYISLDHDILDNEDTFNEWCNYENSVLICTDPDNNSVSTDNISDPITPQAPSGIAVDGTSGEWISDDPNIVTVDQDGRVTGISEGTANIRFVIYDNEGNIIYEYVLPCTVKNANNPSTFDSLPIAAVIAIFSTIGLSRLALKSTSRRR